MDYGCPTRNQLLLHHRYIIDLLFFCRGGLALYTCMLVQVGGISCVLSVRPNVISRTFSGTTASIARCVSLVDRREVGGAPVVPRAVQLQPFNSVEPAPSRRRAAASSSPRRRRRDGRLGSVLLLRCYIVLACAERARERSNALRAYPTK